MQHFLTLTAIRSRPLNRLFSSHFYSHLQQNSFSPSEMNSAPARSPPRRRSRLPPSARAKPLHDENGHAPPSPWHSCRPTHSRVILRTRRPARLGEALLPLATIGWLALTGRHTLRQITRHRRQQHPGRLAALRWPFPTLCQCLQPGSLRPAHHPADCLGRLVVSQQDGSEPSIS